MLRSLKPLLANPARVAAPRPLPASRALASAAAGKDDVSKLVLDALSAKGIKGKDAEEELQKLLKQKINSVDLLRKMNMHDWEAAGVSIGAARSIMDALWQLKHEEAAQKVQKTLKLRRENSDRQENKFKKL